PRRGLALVFVVVLLVLAAVGRRPGAGIEPGAGRETVGFPGRGGLDARGGVLVHLGVPAHDLYLPSDQPIAPADPPRLKMLSRRSQRMGQLTGLTDPFLLGPRPLPNRCPARCRFPAYLVPPPHVGSR